MVLVYTRGAPMVASSSQPPSRSSPPRKSLVLLCLLHVSDCLSIRDRSSPLDSCSHVIAPLAKCHGFDVLDRGIWVYNSFLKRNIFVLGAFGSWLADTPERCACGGLRQPSVWSLRGCQKCYTPLERRLDHLFGQYPTRARCPAV
jgi:hypothetical protein